MRAPHCVDIVLLHEHQIRTHVFDADSLALLRMVIMAIHTTNHDLLAVNQ